VWNFNRIIHRDRVEEIVKFVEDEHNNHKKKWEEIIVHWKLSVCKLQESYYIIDGNHRFLSYKTLKEKYPEFPEISFSIENVDSVEEVWNSFKNINKSIPVPEQYLDPLRLPSIETDIRDAIEKFRKSNKRNIIFKLSKKPIQPNISSNEISDELVKYEFGKIMIYDFLDKLNEFCKNSLHLVEHKPESLKKAKTTNCYFGMFKKNKGFSFADILKLYIEQVKDEYGIKLLKSTTSDKDEKECKSLIMSDKDLREQVWEKYNGESINGACFCCGITLKCLSCWHLGHIIPNKDGGKKTTDNIVPLCSTCNTLMSGNNLFDWIKEQELRNISKYQVGIENVKKYFGQVLKNDF
jgi:hypothetical protein